MKGLKEYIEKHGKHFTVKLAYDVGGHKWTAENIKNSAQKKVYYNVTGSTLGDMVFIVHLYWHTFYNKSKNSCLDNMLSIIGNYYFYGGKVFDLWLYTIKEETFDFTPYIE